MPLVVLSPHLDDAALSCGAMMIHACQTIPVTVATLFTEAGPPPYTLSTRRYLHQVGARDAPALYGSAGRRTAPPCSRWASPACTPGWWTRRSAAGRGHGPGRGGPA